MQAELLEIGTKDFRTADVTVIGRARHGKDTVAKILQVLDDRFERIALADALKEHLAELLETSTQRLDVGRAQFGLTPNRDFFLTEFRNNKAKYRPLLQWFGTEFVRGFDDNYWIKTLNSKSRQQGDRHVLTDARFPNEISDRIDNGDFIIKVQRSEMMIEGSNHASESQIDSLPYHVLIENDGSQEDLFGRVCEVYHRYLR